MNECVSDSVAAHKALLVDVAAVIGLDRVLDKVIARTAEPLDDSRGVEQRQVKHSTPPSRQGTVTTIDLAKGCGFIRPDDGGVDVYFTLSDAVGTLHVGQRVEFDDKPTDAQPSVGHGVERSGVAKPRSRGGRGRWVDLRHAADGAAGE